MTAHSWCYNRPAFFIERPFCCGFSTLIFTHHFSAHLTVHLPELYPVNFQLFDLRRRNSALYNFFFSLYLHLQKQNICRNYSTNINSFVCIQLPSPDSSLRVLAAAVTPSLFNEIHFKEINCSSLSPVGERQGSRAQMSRVLLSQL